MAHSPSVTVYLYMNLIKLDPSAIIPVEKIDCPMLIICGDDDQDVSAVEMAQEIHARMNSHGKSALCSVLSYPGTGHLIEPPFAPHCYASYHKGFKTTFAWGGNAKDHSHAQEDSWQKIVQFFRKNPWSKPQKSSLKMLEEYLLIVKNFE
ncbi:hypothetical protein OS493_013512 [Desmophyllum pertusum]|uniref:BAAT/Acyl-CoA thioester hydrolase C-terminal domain-containing protein n=1 Tax=Desmophyllum pertusum TaxID=174260 RepID=A0A9X0A315_9CNID|nr:hypothetical protein OS493_013512 [Desmophyllum pertusum]